jgi:WD40 repeat protein
MNRRTTLAVLLLLLVESSLAYIVFNYTSRERTPSAIFPCDGAVTCLDVSNWGDALAVGMADGSVAYYQKVKTMPQWVYEGGSTVASILVSSEGGYVLIMDDNHTVSLFRSLGVGVNTPRWSRRLEGGRVLGVHSLGGIPPTVYMLASVEGNILLFSDREGLLWEYSTGASGVTAEISYDGKHVAALDASGRAYFFDIQDSDPVWVSSTEVMDGVLSLSQSSWVAVGGADPYGGGRVSSLSLEDGETLWEWTTASPVTRVSMSGDGSRVVVYEGEGRAWLLAEDSEVDARELGVAAGVESVWSPPFGSYAVALGADGRVYFLYTPRPAPLWVYEAGGDVVDVAVTSTGDRVFVAERDSVAVITNTIETGMIPGSRALWGLWFLAWFAGLVVVYRAAGVELGWLKPVKENYRLLVSGLAVGGILGFAVWGGGLEAFAAAVGCAVGCYIGFSKEGLGGFGAGLFASTAASMAASVLHGLFAWFSGVESNVVVLVVNSVSGGTRAGLVFGFLGTLLGFMFKFRSRFRQPVPS